MKIGEPEAKDEKIDRAVRGIVKFLGTSVNGMEMSDALDVMLRTSSAALNEVMCLLEDIQRKVEADHGRPTSPGWLEERRAMLLEAHAESMQDLRKRELRIVKPKTEASTGSPRTAS